MIDFQDSIYLGVASPNPEKDMSNYYTKAQTRALVDTKQDVITGAATTITDDNLTANRAVISNANGKVDVSNTTSTELGYVHGVTSAIQTQINGKANVGLDNLNADGQMVIDSQNGTISNCILDIPQNIKVTLENNVLTLKAGSVITLCGSTYSTVTTSTDLTVTISTNDTWVVFPKTNGTSISNYIRLNRIGSGSTIPVDDTNYQCFFNTTDKKIYIYNNGAWIEWSVGYPICVIKVESGNTSFAKDSNSNDMIFNGACFVGSNVVVYPFIKCLIPNGYNSDGTLKSIEHTTTALLISYNSLSVEERNTIWINGEGTISRVASTTYTFKDNQWYSGTTPRSLCKFADLTGNVTGMTIRQPVRTATIEMLDTLQDQVDTNTTAISGKQDNLVSGTNIKTINSTTVLGSGNFALADQSLSNLDSTGQMIVDSQNGTISNCILEIPQNIKLELSGTTLTLKAGSILTDSGSTYQTIAINTDRTLLLNDNGTFMVFSTIGGILTRESLTRCVSGETDSLAGTAWHIWFDTTNKEVFEYGSDTATAGHRTYPLCIVKNVNGVATFAKDSNGNDMIFNGAGFIGHHAFVYPNVKGLAPKGFNDDRTLSNLAVNSNALSIQEMSTLSGRCIGFQGGNNIGSFPYKSVDTVDELEQQFIYQYCSETNTVWLWSSNAWSKDTRRLPIIDYTYDGTIVTDFTIRQPVRMATVEMLKDKQNDLTTVSGYDATATQVLKNINGVLTWVTEE